MADKYIKEVAPKYDEINLRITSLQRTYMKAQLELNKKREEIFLMPTVHCA